MVEGFLIDVNMYWFVMFLGNVDDLGKLGVLFGFEVDIVWIDLVFVECGCIVWVVG